MKEETREHFTFLRVQLLVREGVFPPFALGASAETAMLATARGSPGSWGLRWGLPPTLSVLGVLSYVLSQTGGILVELFL